MAGIGLFPPWLGIRRRRQVARDFGEFGIRRSKFFRFLAVLGCSLGTGGKSCVQLNMEQLRREFLIHGGLIAANRRKQYGPDWRRGRDKIWNRASGWKNQWTSLGAISGTSRQREFPAPDQRTLVEMLLKVVLSNVPTAVTAVMITTLCTVLPVSAPSPNLRGI